MGYIRDHAIVVVGTYGNYLDEAHKKAINIFPWVSSISPAGYNDSRSFFIPPDGSKEGWDESEDGDMRRDEFVQYLIEQAYEDGSSPLKWVEVRVSDDELDMRIERSHKDCQPPI
ncbi:hypothetical protein UFOVP1165_20 [uncultured Caudovirales phage]|uniref:Uncharacterized protein n=1 Tax=uncultured Caudovirales phage TaxID=2100421 RepID=A0A6J5QZT9_9CAUD|nr:hypothetical protein UFOVP1165_20 [uncultured Caudovirales phage]